MRASGRDEEVSNRRGTRIRQRMREQRHALGEDEELMRAVQKMSQLNQTKLNQRKRSLVTPPEEKSKTLRINHSRCSGLRQLQVRDALRNQLSKRWRVCAEALLFESARRTHAPDSANVMMSSMRCVRGRCRNDLQTMTTRIKRRGKFM